MSLHAAFAERFEALFATELRRQGVTDTGDWVESLQTYCSYIPHASTSAASSDAPPSGVLVVDMTNLSVGDKPVIALCEALLKLDSPAGRAHGTAVAEWQVVWRRCGLTDRALRHLELLLLGCPRLTLLDVSANNFTADGCASLRLAASEVPCDVVLDDDARATHGGSRPRDASVRSSSLSISPPQESALRTYPPDSQHAGTSDKDPAADPAGAGPQPRSATRKKAWSTTAVTAANAAALHHLRQRSPSLSGTSASVSLSLRSYASGSAEALQRRREELFGPRDSASASSAAPHPASSPQPQQQHPTPLPPPPPLATPSAAVAAPAPSSGGTAQGSPRSPAMTAFAFPGRGSAARPIATAAAPGTPHMDRESAASPPPATTTTVHVSPVRTASPSPNSAARRSATEAVSSRSPFATAGAPAGAAGSDGGGAPATREPFVDRNDQLDLTANLSPVLDSVLDLSALMTRDGALRQVHMFGGAQTVWDVLAAYESAAAQQQQCGSTAEESIDAATSARLPAALLGGTTYNAITVLNLSRNHLTALCPLPATLLRLDVSVNDLTELRGLEACKMLTVLNARRNQLRGISGLEHNLGVAHLFLGHNAIAAVEGVAHLVLLETLDLTFNQIRTQAALRMLSLCSALRHLLLRGNPVLDAGKPGFMAVLRNLCPTLLVVDEHRMTHSRLADRALAQRNWGRQPNMIDTTQPYARNETLRGSGSATAAGPAANSSSAAPSSLLAPVGVGAGPARASVDGSSVSSVAFTASRRREGSRPAPFADDAVDQRSMNLLHLLTRGVTAPTGYGDAARSQHAAQQLAHTRQEQTAQTQAARERRLNASGRPLRGAVVKQLAEESRRYLEETIVRRMTAAQQQQLHPSLTTASAVPSTEATSTTTPRRVSVERNAYGGVAHPDRVQNPMADVMGYSALASPERAVQPGSSREAAEAELLRRYEPRNVRLRRGPSAKRPHQPQQQSSMPAVPSSYAALRAAELAPQLHTQRGAEAEIECSPIVKDPQARLLASLNTTAPICDPTPRRTEQPWQRRPSPHGTAAARRPSPQGHRDPAAAAATDATAVFAAATTGRPQSRPAATARGSAGPGGGVPPRTQQQQQPRPAAAPPASSRSSSPAAAAARVSRCGSRGREAEMARGPTEAAARSGSAAPLRASSPSMRPVHIDSAQRTRVTGWTRQLRDDTEALQDALQTIVDVLAAQRQPNLPTPESSRELPPTYLQERQRCVQIVQDSGMLNDTHVPMDVVVYYGYSKAELEGDVDRSADVVVRRGGGAGQADAEEAERVYAREVAERSEVLRQVHLMGDAKTCLRYVALLVGDGRERLLQQYVDQLQESLRAA